jgi:Kef-type K+ transport system membrane component KefB
MDPLVILLILILVFGVGAGPFWGWGWGWGPSGVLGLIFTITLIVLLFRLLGNGRSPRI